MCRLTPACQLSTAFFGHLRDCAKSRSPLKSEFHFLPKLSVPIDMEATTVPVFDPAGNVTSFRTAFADITLRKRAEAEKSRAFESEQRLRKDLERLDGAVLAVVTALATLSQRSARSIPQVIADQALKLVDAEYAACGLAASQPFDPWVVSGTDEKQLAAIGITPSAAGLSGAVKFQGRALRWRELRQHLAFVGLTPHPLLITSFLGLPISFAGKLTGHLYLINKRGADDFSEDDIRSIEKLAEHAGIAMEISRLELELDSAVHSREDLLAVVSHDLRGPLSSITIGTNMIRLQDKEESSLGNQQQRARAFGSTALFPRSFPWSPCDRDRVLQVLANLVGNAIKFPPPGGGVCIDVGAWDGEIHFKISDSGPGIPEEEHPYLFDRYWKSKPSGRFGTGLGLYIAEGIVKSHGGRIWVESCVGIGSTFLFTLPISPKSL